MKILYSVLLLLIFGGCSISKRSKDRSMINYIRKNQAFIKECATFSIAATIDPKRNEFMVADIKDRKLRNKMASLGSKVYVTYEKGRYPNEIPDSNVTFKSMALLGVFEVIYDFASRERDFSGNVSNKADYYFVKVTDRIYYRRSRIPMM